MDEARHVRVAIVGAGPAGIYAADFINRRPELTEGTVTATIDLFDQNITPFGLIRYGVAPDHPRIKAITDSLHKILDRGNTRFFGNVDVGEGVPLSAIRSHYDAVILATGARQDRPLQIPGVPPTCLHGAADFISWYDGNPEGSRSWPLTARNVGVIGNGNVALDIARILGKSAGQLLATEIPDNVYLGLETAETTDIHIFGRRGPSEVKFTPLELRELGEQKDLAIVLDPKDFTPDAAVGGNQVRAMQTTFAGWLDSAPTTAARRIHFHFFHTAVAATTALENLSSVEFEVRRPNQPVERVSHPIEALYHAVGYESTPVAGAPWDNKGKIIPNSAGRVLDPQHDPIPGLYVTGWIKRGPVGLIGRTKSDAKETIASLFDDLFGGSRDHSSDITKVDLIPLLKGYGSAVTTWENWKRLSAHEGELGLNYVTGAGLPFARDRVKLVERDEMIQAGTLT